MSFAAGKDACFAVVFIFALIGVVVWMIRRMVMEERGRKKEILKAASTVDLDFGNNTMMEPSDVEFHHGIRESGDADAQSRMSKDEESGDAEKAELASNYAERLEVKILWPDERRVTFKDFRFEFPRYAKTMYTITLALLWIVAIVCTVGGVVMISQFAVGGVALIVGAWILLPLELYAARLVYELTILFFEHLKVMRQIRDLLATKMV